MTKFTKPGWWLQLLLGGILPLKFGWIAIAMLAAAIFSNRSDSLTRLFLAGWSGSGVAGMLALWSMILFGPERVCANVWPRRLMISGLLAGETAVLVVLAFFFEKKNFQYDYPTWISLAGATGVGVYYLRLLTRRGVAQLG